MIKKLVFGLVCSTLVFSSMVFAQNVSNDAAKSSVKALKKSLSKNSRFGDEVVYWFSPIKFEGCQVSFRFNRLNENPEERFGNLYFERSSGVYRNNTVRTSELPNVYTQEDYNRRITIPPNTTRMGVVNGRISTFDANSFSYYTSGLNNRIFSIESFITILDFSMIDADSVKLQKNEKGKFFIRYKSLKDKTAIGKMIVGGSETDVMPLESDFIPVSSEKGGNKLSEKFIETVKACQQ